LENENDEQYLMKQFVKAKWIEEEVNGKKIIHD
jgi:hypothetical protein